MVEQGDSRNSGLSAKGTEEGERITIARKGIRCRIESSKRENIQSCKGREVWPEPPNWGVWVWGEVTIQEYQREVLATWKFWSAAVIKLI